MQPYIKIKICATEATATQRVKLLFFRFQRRSLAACKDSSGNEAQVSYK